MNTTITSSKERFLESFSSNLIHGKARIQASENLKLLDFPTTRNENWKYTRVAPILKHDYRVLNSAVSKEIDVNNFKIGGLTANVLVFVNGFFVPEKSLVLSSEKDLIITNIANARENYSHVFDSYFAGLADDKNEIFTAINTAYSEDGTFIFVPDNTTVALPTHLIYLTQGDSVISQPRNVIVSGKSSSAKVIITYETIDSNRAFTNAVSEVWVKENAHLEIDKVQYENDTTSHISTEQVHQQANSNFTINTVTLNGGLVRNNLNIELDATNCESNLYGLYLLKGNQHVDNHTLVDHKKPHCNSNELYKGIMDGESTAVFNGKVFVRPDAQKTNAFQSNSNILLSDDASINSKPELEIYADDVKCSHGSTTGQMDKDAIFYLRARGVGEDSARNMLMYAFASDVIDNIKVLPLQEKINSFLDKKFNSFF